MEAPEERRLDEGRLVERVLSGDEGAFRVLYRANTARLFRLALRLSGGVVADAEDLVQEAWHRAIRGLDRFEGRASLATWLSSIVTRCAMERFRTDRRDASSQAHAEPTVAAQDSARRLDLEHAFEKLPTGFRSVLVLHDLEGYRHSDIAELLGVSEGTSKSQLSRARARMRELLGEDYGQR